MKAKLRIISQIVFSFHFIGILGASAQDQSNEYSRLILKLICPKREIVAGQNFEFQVVISNSAQYRIRSTPPAYMAYLDLVIQKNGHTVPYQIKYQRSGLGPDLEIEPNRTWSWYGDLYEGHPFGIGEGNFALFATYSPNPTNGSFKIWSNPVQLTVLRRSPEQEEQYNYYMKLFRPSEEKSIKLTLQFLATYTNSPFEPTMRLVLGRSYLYRGDYALAVKVLEVLPLLPATTKKEIASMHYELARALHEQGYFYEAVVECDASPVPINNHEINQWRAKLTKASLSAEVKLETAAVEVSPGILTAHVRLPEGYPVSGITTATCDHAPAERMTLSDDGTEMIMKFRRQDIEAAQARIGKNIDTNFVVQGNWTGTVVTARGNRTSSYFWGTASIMKIVKEETQDKTRDKDENKDTDKEKNKGK